MKKDQVQRLIHTLEDSEIELLNDKFHSFSELYQFRKVYNAALFNEWGKERAKFDSNTNLYQGKYDVHKSWRHNDGELCLGGGRFIVVAVLPTGQISNHYEAKDWDLFRIPETPTAKYAWDGHEAKDVLKRLMAL